MRVIITTLFLLLLIISPQGDMAAQATDQKLKDDSKREEVQRYFGYESPLTGYVTLPIDVSLNTNERGYFVDIGFIFLLLLPLLLLIKVGSKNRALGFALLGLLFVIMCLYASTSFVMSEGYTKITHGNISMYTPTNNSFVEDLYAQLLMGLNMIGSPIGSFIANISSGTDHISYPVVIILLGIVIFLFTELKLSSKKKSLALFIALFGFYWLILSAGIIWYGYLLFPLLIVGLLRFAAGSDNSYLPKIIFGTLSLWLLVALFGRTTFTPLGPNPDKDTIGKYIVNQVFIQRTLGLETTAKSIEKMHPGLNGAMQSINNNPNSLILKLGTTLGYFVDNGDSRIVNNNQLSIIDKFIQTYKTKDQINKALRLANIKYLLVDLNSATLDRTPERTLTVKFNRLLQFLFDNEELSLLATDRVLQPSAENPNKYRYGFTGDVYYSGTYAIFEIN